MSAYEEENARPIGELQARVSTLEGQVNWLMRYGYLEPPEAREQRANVQRPVLESSPSFDTVAQISYGKRP